MLCTSCVQRRLGAFQIRLNLSPTPPFNSCAMLDLFAEIRSVLERERDWYGATFVPDDVRREPEITTIPLVPDIVQTPYYQRFNARIVEEHPAKTTYALDALAHVSARQTWPGAAVQHVWSTGNPSSDFMILGEMPAPEDEAAGAPFSGKAGELLEKMLTAIQFPRESVYATTILKRRMLDAGTPRAAAIAAALPVLWQEIALVQPKILLCFGTAPAQLLLHSSANNIETLRKQDLELNGIPFVVSYPPSVLMEQATYKRPAWEDLKKVRRFFDALPAG